MAVHTNKRAVVCFSAHTEPSKYLSFKYLRAGFCFLLKDRLSSGLAKAGTDSPPFSFPANTSASYFKGAYYIPLSAWYRFSPNWNYAGQRITVLTIIQQ